MNESIVARSGSTSLSTFLSGWEHRKEMANVLIRSGFLPAAYKTPEQVITVMLTAHELGIPEMEALRSINVIQGKPTVSPQLMLALINRSRQLEDMKIADDGRTCTVTMKRKGRQTHAEAFGVDDADRMMTTEGFGENKRQIKLSEKYNWKQMPKIMRKWRAVAACARIVFPDVITGLCTPEEMGADVNYDDEEAATVEVLPELAIGRGETLDTQTGEIGEPEQPPPPPVTVNGATFQTFDPAVETIGFGKYGGLKWVECDMGYLRWLANSANKPDTKAKAEATLKAIEAVKAQRAEAALTEGDAFEGTFDEKPPEDPAITLSRKVREDITKAIEAAKTVAALRTAANSITHAASAGELTLEDQEALQALGKTRLNQIRTQKA